MKEKQGYHSRLRQEQKERTREQILEGLVRAMANGIATLSIPAVAREAGVSVPTVYRYFRTKGELVAALGGYLLEKSGVANMQPAHSPEELVANVRQAFLKFEGLDETMRAASVSELSYRMRKEGLPWRLKAIEDALAPVLANLNEVDRIRLRNVVLILSSSAMVRAFKDYLDLSGEQAADNVTWAILTLARAASQGSEKSRDA
jgi:AcrR family transcriptional regulator